MMQIKNVSIILMMFFVFSLFPVCGSFENQIDSEISDEVLEEIISKTSFADLPEFENYRADGSVLAICGEIPKTKPGRESYEWMIYLEDIARRVSDDENLTDYYYDNGGPIIGIAYNNHISILIDENYSEKLTEENLLLFENTVEKYNSRNEKVPLVIRKKQIPIVEINQNDGEQKSVSGINDYYIGYVRPLIGGVRCEATGTGTVGYIAKHINNSSDIGIITA
ncbi:MAG: hypothetical protein II940_02955, partial [Methanosarcinaceae archaeon]|nr:hypothetical protein [Methanosarcinaceae archaeon]